MDRLVDRIVTFQASRGGSSGTEDAVFGPVGPRAVAGWYERLCEMVLGSPVGDARFFTASAGCVAGLELTDGRSVAVKAYQRRWQLDHLVQVASATTLLAARAFPCPVPVADPVVFEGVTATIDSMLTDPGMRHLVAAEATLSAAALAEAAATLAELDASAWAGRHAMTAGPTSLYPPPHDPSFDFTLDPAGAAWIDRLAGAALAVLSTDTGRPQWIHGDWSARNLRFDHGQLVASFDWDSLAAFPDSRGAGIAAATWRLTGEDDDPPAPGLDEVESYLECYADAAGGRNASWRRSAIASALYALAYTARCEHAIAAVSAVDAPARATLTLRRDGPRFASRL